MAWNIKNNKINFSLSSLGERSETRGSIGQECNMNAGAYSNLYSGFRIKSGMTEKGGFRIKCTMALSSLSFYGERSKTGESIKQQCRMDTPVKPEYDRRGEYGRSMVEILGMLAIIGVLSIGGIAGYSYGMDKYRANETINSIMMRGIDVMTQLNNKNIPSLKEWEKDKTFYPISLHMPENNIVMLKVENVPQRICQMIGDSLENTTSVFVENSQLNNEEDPCLNSDLNTMYFSFTDSTTCNTSCNGDEECLNGHCVKPASKISNIEGTAIYQDNNCTTDNDCNIGYSGTCSICLSGGKCAGVSYYAGNACTFDNGTAGQCSNTGTCIPKDNCTSNDMCDNGYYCAGKNTNADTPFPEGETGTCIKADFMYAEINNDIYYLSTTPLMGWDARLACEAINKEFLNIEELIPQDVYSPPYLATDLSVELSNIFGKHQVWAINNGDFCNVGLGIYDSCSGGKFILL